MLMRFPIRIFDAETIINSSIKGNSIGAEKSQPCVTEPIPTFLVRYCLDRWDNDDLLRSSNGTNPAISKKEWRETGCRNCCSCWRRLARSAAVISPTVLARKGGKETLE